MWDTVPTNEVHLSHDMPCARCGHDVHTFLACCTGCACEPVVMPGVRNKRAPHSAPTTDLSADLG